MTKRTLDLLVSIIGLLLLSLPLAMVAILIKLDSRGPVFFRQERIGLRGRPFYIYKFRTMVDGAVRQGLGFRTERADPRITRVGRFLREFSVDEAPQLMNVLLGDMSLVGPRPTLRHQVEEYSPRQRRRLEVRPGITSLASVKGRNAISWKQRIELDIEYVERHSFWLDMLILLRTPWVAFVSRNGVYAEGEANDDFRAESTTEQAR